MLLAIHWFDRWGHIDWGNFPTWLGAVVTSGSLTVALLVYLRDRRRHMRSQVSRVAVNFMRSLVVFDIAPPSEAFEYTAHVDILNRSDQDLFYPRIESTFVEMPDAQGNYSGRIHRVYPMSWDTTKTQTVWGTVIEPG